VTYEAPVTANVAGMISTSVVCPSITLADCVKTPEYMYIVTPWSPGDFAVLTPNIAGKFRRTRR